MTNKLKQLIELPIFLKKKNGLNTLMILFFQFLNKYQIFIYQIIIMIINEFCNHQILLIYSKNFKDILLVCTKTNKITVKYLVCLHKNAKLNSYQRELVTSKDPCQYILQVRTEVACSSL